MAYNIGDKVEIVSDNDSYDGYRDKTLTVNLIASNTAEHRGYDGGMGGMQLMGFEDENGEGVPFALYEYEVQSV